MDPSIARLRAARRALRADRKETRLARKAYQRALKAGKPYAKLRDAWQREMAEDVAAEELKEQALADSAEARNARCARTWGYIMEAAGFAASVATGSVSDAIADALLEHPGIPVTDAHRDTVRDLVGLLGVAQP